MYVHPVFFVAAATLVILFLIYATLVALSNASWHSNIGETNKANIWGAVALLAHASMLVVSFILGMYWPW